MARKTLAQSTKHLLDVDVGYDETSKVYYVLTSGLSDLHVETAVDLMPVNGR